MIGGFLGAGKTTAIARLARHYMDEGLNVGLVTNDQAYDLVDTQSLRAQGFQVGEVPGACFCCKFNDLVETAAALSADQQPDIIITEPVGSCTDLVATVIEPLRHLHGDQYEIAPLAVLLKPEHGRKILGGGEGGFSPKAEYVFLKQLEEASLVVVNKADKLSAAERQELLAQIEDRFPGKTALAASAKTGENFDALVAALEQTTTAAGRMMDVDYDVYAEGEAELGWLNCTATVRGETEFSLDDLLVDYLARLASALRASASEPAHLKVLGQAGGESAIANLVASSAGAELSLASEVRTASADLVVNARVATDPELLATLAKNELVAVAFERSLTVDFGEIQRFRPGRPTPTHRVTG
jgi:Ni2+-binding GTPase involved in maturation of urease and hydrogenase